jgi:hypothetical protein
MSAIVAFVFIIFPLYLVTFAILLSAPLFLLRKLAVDYLEYKSKKSFFDQSYILLELRLPKEVSRSPVGMELLFTALYQTAATSYHEFYVQGKRRPSYSFELVSIEGKVHFFIYTIKKWRNIIEAQIYAQYPNIEISEAEDYTRAVNHDPDKLVMWGTQFMKKKASAFPIKTYIDYGLDKDPKEEFKIDPMTSVLEYLGSLGKGEQTWIQIIFRAHKKEDKKHGRLFTKPDWSAEVKKEIKKLREQGVLGEGDNPKFPNPTRGEQDLIASMERNLSKMPFDTCIRGFYIADKNIFNANLGLTGLIGSFRQYNSINSNEFQIRNLFTDFDDTGKDILSLFGWIWPVGQIGRWIRDGQEKQMLNNFKWRFGLIEPYYKFNPPPYIMTAEELATVFHFPGQVLTTPTVARSMSKKAEPPPNLPI